jgi:hypothetical protein
VSAETPKIKSEISPAKLSAKKLEKSRVGMGKRISKV